MIEMFEMVLNRRGSGKRVSGKFCGSEQTGRGFSFSGGPVECLVLVLAYLLLSGLAGCVDGGWDANSGITGNKGFIA